MLLAGSDPGAGLAKSGVAEKGLTAGPPVAAGHHCSQNGLMAVSPRKSSAAPDLSARRNDFPSLQREVDGFPISYFDGPGGTQVPEQVIGAISEYYRNRNANTHGEFVTSRESDQVIEDARAACAALLNSPSSHQVSFGANMTSLNFALSHAIGKALQPGDEILISQLDHEANRGPWLGLRDRGIVIREIVMKCDGTLDYEDFENKLSERTRLVAVGWASNAMGTVNDLRRIRTASLEAGSWMLVDAVHYAPHFLMDVQEAGFDFLLCSAYKFYGPHVGILYCRQNLLDQLNTDRLRTQDAQAPYRIETGTLNHAALAGVSAAVRYLASLGEGDSLRSQLVSGMSALSAHEGRLGRMLHEGLRQIPQNLVYGPPFGDQQRAPTVAFRMKNHDPAAVARSLAAQGICVWNGDFYAARAVELLGVADRGGLVRAGISLYTTEAEVDRLLEMIRRLAG